MRAIALVITLTASLLGGCTLFGDNFSKAEALLAEIRDVNAQHNDMRDNLPQQVDDIKVAKLLKEYNERWTKDKKILLDLQSELRKSQQNNQYQLQYLGNLLKKTTNIKAKISTIEKPFQEVAMDTLNLVTKQYEMEKKYFTYNLSYETNIITDITYKLNGKTPPPSKDIGLPINQNILDNLQTGVDGYIKLFEEKIDEEKEKG